MNDKEYLRQLLEKMSGLFDSLYECMDENEREIVCEVEGEFYSYFKKRDMI